MKPTEESLKKTFLYCPSTGLFIRIASSRGQKKGAIAGGMSDQGYIKISIKGKLYLAHRLAWLYMTGEWPKEEIDHINNIRNDNKWSNIRAATRSENNRNTGISITNKSGAKGVSWSKSHGKWRARICIDKAEQEKRQLKTNNLSLGFYKDKQDAINSYQVACIKYHGEFARLA
ncbi:MAG: hypothetical protein COB69_00210 [Phycisphaera sp.]|nr:MAG: hypothetical protein COB69_00210 [Phycisphaera sp.]